MTRNIKRHHGLALMIVIAVVAMASLIGLAMLSNASLQAQAANNHQRSTEADYLAESALQTGEYYLQRSFVGMPASWAGTAGYSIFAENVTMSGVDGTFDLKVSPTTMSDVYSVVATGKSTGSTGIARTMTSQVRVLRATPTFSGGFGGASIINLQNYFNGAPVVATAGLLSGGGLLNLLLGQRAPTSDDFIVPSVGSGSINYYGADIAGGTYTTPTGVVGTPQTLASGTIASPATLTALPTNPGKVFYYPGHVFINGAGNYTGTIISRGKIEINPPLGSTVTWNREAGFPAMMSDGSILVNSKSLNMTVNGVVFAGGGTSWAALLAVTGSAMRINGALLIPAGKNVGVGGLGSLSVTFTPANVDVQNMTTTPQPAMGLKLLSWDQ